MALLSKKEYLDWARKAFDFVKGAMTKGAANRILDQPSGTTLASRRQCVYGEMRKQTTPDIIAAHHNLIAQKQKQLIGIYGGEAKNLEKVVPSDLWQKSWEEVVTESQAESIDINAQYALEYGCGNCEEQSSLTFAYLRDNGIKPLDWLKQEGFLGEFGNHAFVILGRDRKAPIKDVSAWNPEAVWCDPYENEMGGLDKISERFEGKDLSLLYRWEDS
jgi:hypothetical protein